MGFHGNSEVILELGLNLSSKKPISFEPSLTLSLSADNSSASGSGSSSFSINGSVKREREVASTNTINTNSTSAGEDGTEEDEDGGYVNCRKKLRLTKAQSGLLEQAFKLHTTLNLKQKEELAKDLKLRPRQVEVWFQNRRARTKLKRTEVDCEYLKKWCKTLTEENQRLRQEVEELKVSTQSIYMQLPAASLDMCPSCQKIVGDDVSNSSSTKTPFKPQLFNPQFTTSSAAC